MKYLIGFILLFSVAEAQFISPGKPFSSSVTATAVFKSDSFSVVPYLKFGRQLTGSISNTSATDTLKFFYGNRWADTTSFMRIPPATTFNFLWDQASWIKWFSCASPGGAAVRIINLN